MTTRKLRQPDPSVRRGYRDVTIIGLVLSAVLGMGNLYFYLKGKREE